MPTADVNGITVNYQLEGGPDIAGGELVVLVNGLADDLQTWDYQVPALLEAGFRVLRYDNRGIGATSRPPGPYTASLLATDLHALLAHLKIDSFHLLGVSMGGMIAQAYALAYPNDLSTTSATTISSDDPQPTSSSKATNPHIISLTLACTYAHPTPFCTRMFSIWSSMATQMSVQVVMRDVLLWAFTVPFFLDREDEVRDFERAMETLDMDTETYLAQLNVIQTFDTIGELENLDKEGRALGGVRDGRVMVLAGEEDILIPVLVSRRLCDLIKGAVWKTVKGGHGCMWEFPKAFNEVYVQFLKS